MADPFVAEIRMFGFNFPPKGWAFCNGQIMPVSQNTALFSLVGTVYGGDGKSNFALPDLQGRAPMQPREGPGLSLHDLGELGGVETVTLRDLETPSHSHPIKTASPQDPGNLQVGSPTRVFAASGSGQAYNAATTLVALAPQALAPTGGSGPHNNMMPYLTLNFCIALQGIYPPRS